MLDPSAPAQQEAARPAKFRDRRLDFLRGYAIMTITVNHAGGLAAAYGYDEFYVPTLTTVTFGSAAALFYFLSGYMVGMIYLSRPTFVQAMWSRARTLYGYNLAVFAACTVIVLLAPAAIGEATHYGPILAAPLEHTLLFALLMYSPYLMDVLQVYVLFMLVAIPFSVGLRRWPGVVLGLSIGLYLAVQIVPDINLPGGPLDDDGQWNFNPFAWQLLFFGGIILGERRTFSRILDWMAARPMASLAILAAVGVVVAGQAVAVFHDLEAPLAAKENLGPLRLLSAAVTTAGLMVVAALAVRILDWPVISIVSLLGRKSLVAFSASIPLTFLGGWLFLALGETQTAYLAMIAAIAAGVVAAAFVSR